MLLRGRALATEGSGSGRIADSDPVERNPSSILGKSKAFSSVGPFRAVLSPSGDTRPGRTIFRGFRLTPYSAAACVEDLEKTGWSKNIEEKPKAVPENPRMRYSVGPRKSMQRNSPTKLAKVNATVVDQRKVGRGRDLSVHGRSSRKSQLNEDSIEGVVIVGGVLWRNQQMF